ncbi:hypothetical protein I4F81_005764 [Pyropia yezoensis]|uniref:Uncharacterized protein n=1 Tax=Pyropia yezoensis TaxID=2788 RepID=A0ACC3C019_PYRYE|nr:hypothetical protein I4F81_005764 [Neopyropia yezoensis]
MGGDGLGGHGADGWPLRRSCTLHSRAQSASTEPHRAVAAASPPAHQCVTWAGADGAAAAVAAAAGHVARPSACAWERAVHGVDGAVLRPPPPPPAPSSPIHYSAALPHHLPPT